MNAEKSGRRPRIDRLFVWGLNAISAAALFHRNHLRTGLNSRAAFVLAIAEFAINTGSIANSTLPQTDGTATDWDVGESEGE